MTQNEQTEANFANWKWSLTEALKNVVLVLNAFKENDLGMTYQTSHSEVSTNDAHQ